MYKVMIVDDELIIRAGVKATINWEDERLQFAGEYSNGAEALQALEVEPVDILLTDIKMPLVDGLELTRQAKQKYFDIKVILISSYSDFDYVRESVVLGAIDYILKSTIESEELAALLERAIQLIEKDRLLHQSVSRFQQNVQEVKRRKSEHDFKKVLSQDMDEDTFAQCLSEAYQDKGYSMIVSLLNGTKELQEKKGFLYLSMLKVELQEQFYLHDNDGLSIVINESQIVFLTPLTTNIVNLKENLETRTGLRLTFGYVTESQPKNWLSNYHKTCNVYERHFFDGSGGLYDYSHSCPDGSPQLEDTYHPELLMKIKEFAPDMTIRLNSWLQQWKKESIQAEHIKREACDLFSGLVGKHIDLLLLLEYCGQLLKSETFHELWTNLLSGVHECCRAIEADEPYKSTNSVIDKAMKFIHEHYTEDITLQTVADHVHISRNYFSLLYKKHTQLNFIDYLIQLRVKRAKELLRNKTTKIYEVASESGFNDVKYFSKLFKKMTGLTPAEYREQCQGIEHREVE